MNDNDFRLDFIRGSVAPKKHNARTIAALTSNPGCARRSILDAAAVDKQELAEHLGYRPQFGQSPFDLTRGKALSDGYLKCQARLLWAVRAVRGGHVECDL